MRSSRFPATSEELRAASDKAATRGSLLALGARDDAVFGIGALLATAPSALADRIEQRLPLITHPTVVVRGEDDGFVGQSWAETALLPRSRLSLFPVSRMLCTTPGVT